MFVLDLVLAILVHFALVSSPVILSLLFLGGIMAHERRAERKAKAMTTRQR